MSSTRMPLKTFLMAAPVFGCLVWGGAASAQSSLDQISARMAPLNLTPTQQSQLNSLIASETPRFASLSRELRRGENDLIKGGVSPDQAASEIGDAAKNLALEIATLNSGINQMLTPSQQADLPSIRLSTIYKKLLSGGGKGGGGGHHGQGSGQGYGGGAAGGPPGGAPGGGDDDNN